MSLAEKFEEYRATCSGCKTKPIRAPKQRYCKQCHNEASKKYRAQLKPLIAKARELIRST